MRNVCLLLLLMTLMAGAQPLPPTSSENEAGFLFRQGLSLYETGEYRRSVDLYRKALRLEPDRLEIRPYLAQALYADKRYEPALRQLELYLGEEPTDSKVALVRVKTLVALERYGQASDALQSLRHHFSNSSWEWHNLRGYLAEQEGQVKVAESSYLRALELAPEAVEPATNLVTLLVNGERLEEASKLLTKMLDKRGDDPQVLNAFALLLSRTDHGFDPTPLLEKLKEKSLPFELQHNLAAALAERGELSQAGILAGDLVDRFVDEPRASWLYGRVLLQRRELQEAGDYLLQAQPKLTLTHEVAATMAVYTYLTRDYAESVRWFRQASELKPDDASLYHNLSLALSHLDKLEEAIGASRKAVTMDPEDSRSVYQLALVLDRNGSFEEAVKYLERFTELSEDPEQVRTVREHLQELKLKKDL